MKSSKLVTLWLPLAMEPYIDKVVRRLDTDRSKFIRNAIRDKLEENGVKVDEVEAAAEEVSA